MKMTKVKLRKKAITNKRFSLYLDYYPPIIDKETGKKTRREFLGMYIFDKPKNPIDKGHNKEVMQLANSIRSQRELDLQKGALGLITVAKQKQDFFEYFDKLCKEKYGSLGNYGNWMSVLKKLKAFRPHSFTMEEIDTTLVKDFKTFLEKDTSIKQNTRSSYFSKFKAALNKATDDGYFLDNPAKKVKHITTEDTYREYLTIKEIKTLAQTSCKDESIKQAFLFSAFSSLRFSDIKKLTWKEIIKDGEDTSLKIRAKKTQKYITIPLPDPALKILDSLENKSQKVFPDLDIIQNHTRALKAWIKEAGIEKHITFHNARHSYATLILAEGADIYTVSKLLGHKNVKTTQIYSKVMDKNKTKAVNKLNEIEL